MTIIHRRQQPSGVSPTGPTGPPTPGMEQINPVYAALLRVFGPPDTPDGPLTGTKYDTRVAAQRERAKFEQRRVRANARWQRWNKRLHGHNPVPPPFPAPGAIGEDGSEQAAPASDGHRRGA